MAKNWKSYSAVIAVGIVAATGTSAEEITFASANAAANRDAFAKITKPWVEATGNTVKLIQMPMSSSEQFAQYRLWLSAGTTDVDVYQTDVVWAPQLADHMVDLKKAAKDVIPLHFPSIIESQTVNGKLAALPVWSDAPVLYYRKDLLKKYNKPVPTTWEELTTTAKVIQDAERAAGKPDMWGYLWQGNAYEGLTCNALEWIKSYGGGRIIENDGSISVNNPKAAAALKLAASWVGNISPAGVLAYKEEESRGVWQTGNAVFLRNWPFVYALSNKDDSAVKGLFDVATLPVGPGEKTSAATLGGWNVAVSRYSKKQEAAVSFALYLASAEGQKIRALEMSQLPTVMSLYDDPKIAAAYPMIPRWKEVFMQTVPRPSAQVRLKYNEVSSRFWSAVHKTLSGKGSAAENLEELEVQLQDLKNGKAW